VHHLPVAGGAPLRARRHPGDAPTPRGPRGTSARPRALRSGRTGARAAPDRPAHAGPTGGAQGRRGRAGRDRAAPTPTLTPTLTPTWSRDMLSAEAVQALLHDLESDRVERTESTSNTDKFARAVCAFANDMPGHGKPGVLIIGARDDGALAGLRVTDQLLQNLGALRSDGNILPLPSIRVQRLSLEGGELAVVEVDPSDLPPVRYKGQVCIRVGPRRANANEQEERILSERRTARAATFDVHPVPGARVSELSLRLFDEYRSAVVSPEVRAANHRTLEERLASLRFYDLRRDAPTVAGVLLFGINPVYHLPGASVTFLRFAGATLAERPSDELIAAGDLQTIVELVLQKVRAHNRAAPAPAGGFREQAAFDYPEVALRELFLNAVIHRDYQSNAPIRLYWFDDRIELLSPGGLYGIVTAATLERRNDYRNPVLAEAMRTLGYVNKFGYGIQRARAALAANGNPPPEFDIDDRAFSVVLRRRPA
jgi:ATP-dependent DNA helicase RecG